MRPLAYFALVLALIGMGCVERKMLIRSDPSGAPAFVDEKPVGKTPVEVPFSHYGRRRIRVGPVTDDSGNVQHLESERIYETAPPWYQRFPTDFFTEVLWPGRLVDEHEIELRLTPMSPQYVPSGSDTARQIKQEAEEYRHESLRGISEQE
ncbi:MAG: PEGA domain-containing protein [Planctomycetota bacterium]